MLLCLSLVGIAQSMLELWSIEMLIESCLKLVGKKNNKTERDRRTSSMVSNWMGDRLRRSSMVSNWMGDRLRKLHLIILHLIILHYIEHGQ